MKRELKLIIKHAREAVKDLRTQTGIQNFIGALLIEGTIVIVAAIYMGVVGIIIAVIASVLVAFLLAYIAASIECEKLKTEGLPKTGFFELGDIAPAGRAYKDVIINATEPTKRREETEEPPKLHEKPQSLIVLSHEATHEEKPEAQETHE